MNLCHGYLNALQLSTPELEELVHIARKHGAIGAKLTGGGGGKDRQGKAKGKGQARGAGPGPLRGAGRGEGKGMGPGPKRSRAPPYPSSRRGAGFEATELGFKLFSSCDVTLAAALDGLASYKLEKENGVPTESSKPLWQCLELLRSHKSE